MYHRKHLKKLGRTSAHREALFRNQATELFRHGRIRTTLPKAKALRPVVEKMITAAKHAHQDPSKGVHKRRLVAKMIRDRKVLQKLFNEIAPRYAERPGGYTRIIKLGHRLGDNAPEAIIELVQD
ncbi:MAG: 50S ribosomal protein L17 [Candidatus Poribacteria bacterium]|nr:MAG: 50S ribosomal protein L17 [Candidatus Poribacteria bacterium]